MLNFSKRITLAEIGKKICRSDNRSVIAWLESKNIPYRKVRGEYFVFQWHLDFNDAMELAEDLKVRFPLNWFKILDATLEDKRLVAAVFEILTPEPVLQKGMNKSHGKTFFDL